MGSFARGDFEQVLFLSWETALFGHLPEQNAECQVLSMALVLFVCFSLDFVGPSPLEISFALVKGRRAPCEKCVFQDLEF